MNTPAAGRKDSQIGDDETAEDKCTRKRILAP
jgi:hypothetical protein